MIRCQLRTLLVAIICAASGLSCTQAPVPAARSIGPRMASPWIATWAPSQSATAVRPAVGMPDRVPTYANATIREIVHTTIGGDHVRIRISNEYGDRPIVVGAAHIALRTSGPTTNAESDRALSFGGKPSVIVRAGAAVVSDPTVRWRSCRPGTSTRPARSPPCRRDTS